MSFEAWAAEVRRLADERDAVILAHNYQVPWIQDVAHHVGDSLALSRIAADTDASTIVFCGVHFMAETAKLLSPDKTVLLPSLEAGCSLAASIDRRPAPRVEGRAPRRGRRRLREHERRGEGGVRHLLHVVQRRRRGRLDPRGPARSCSCPTSSSGRTSSGRPAGRCTSGWGSATCTPASSPATCKAKLAAEPDAELLVHPECGCTTNVMWLLGEGELPADRTKVLSTGGMVSEAEALAAPPVPRRDRDGHPAPAAAREPRQGVRADRPPRPSAST